MTKNQLKMIIEKIANINYIYIPLFMLSADNLRCAFVNVVNSKSIIDIYLKLKKLNFKYDNPNTKIEITYSILQGKKALIENYRDERNIFKNSQNYIFQIINIIGNQFISIMIKEIKILINVLCILAIAIILILQFNNIKCIKNYIIM